LSRFAVAFTVAAVVIGALLGAAEATPVEEAPVYAIDNYPYQKAPALKQWRSVLDRSAEDEADARPDDCDDGAPELDCAAKAAHQLEAALKDKTPVEQIYGVYSYFNAIKWKEHGRGCTEDCWATRLQFIARRQGDCGDHALAEYFTLKRLGFQERDLQLIVVQLPGFEDSFKGGHVVLRVAAADKYYILDNRRTDVTGLTGLEKYKVLAGLNADSVQIYNLVTPNPPAGFVADETKVAALIDSPGTLPKAIPAVAVAEEPAPTVKEIVQQASLAPAATEAEAAPPPEAEEDALMDCTQTATLGDWNPNLPCSDFELPKKVAAKVKPEKKQPTQVAALTPAAAVQKVVQADTTPLVDTPAKPAKKKATSKSVAKATSKTKPTTKVAAAKPTSKAKPKPTLVASAKASQKPVKKKKKKKPADDGGSCVQGATSIADWNTNLPCASAESASRLKLIDVPPAL
jgi:predicted transglutaminase-like cysteine proteinase